MSQAAKCPKPVLLAILDGWGVCDSTEYNAISSANTPFMDEIVKNNPHALISTSGLDVGLPEGQMGNSEVGHMNIGSGRIIMQDLPLIDIAIKDKSINSNPEIVNLINKLKATKGSCHIMGLLSDGGVHSHYNHLLAVAKIIALSGIAVKIHAFLDGRDTPPNSAKEYVTKLLHDIKDQKLIQLVSISGRYYPMDRDKRWDRVNLAYNAIVCADGVKSKDLLKSIDDSYAINKYDEFIKPTIIDDYKGMSDGDGIFLANFRSDRMRELSLALADPDFKDFKRDKIIKYSAMVSITEYSAELNKWLAVVFKPKLLKDIFGEVISGKGLKQLRIAETEKYAHITFFFNGGREEPFIGEERILVPSPQVTTYDLKPEMSAFEVTDKLLAAIESEKFDFIVVNYANTDMVGHSGNMQAAVKAVEAVDKCLARVSKAVENKGGIMLITADHGNAEQMFDEANDVPHTAHTTNLVPLIFAGQVASGIKIKNGRLCDIAPTLLELMNIAKPDSMTGESLII